MRRHSFFGLEGAVDLDIWLASGPDLAAWLKTMNSISGPRLFPLMEPNATVAGRPAIIYIDSPDSPQTMFTVLFQAVRLIGLWTK